MIQIIVDLMHLSMSTPGWGFAIAEWKISHPGDNSSCKCPYPGDKMNFLRIPPAAQLGTGGA